MKVSIITVVYNAASTIEDTITSVLNQSYPNIEYIIVDGQSNDGSIDIIKKYSNKISKFKSEKDEGIYDAMNKGIAMATGDVIGILNADDVYEHSDVIKNIVDKFQEKNPDAVYADLKYVMKDDLNKVIRYWKSGKYRDGKFLYGWMPPHPTFFVKKDTYNKLGLYRTDLKSASDYELMLRFIHVNKINIDYLPEVIIRMREGGVSNHSIKNRLNANKEDRKAWELNNIKPGPFTLILKPLSKLLQFIIKE